MSNGLMKYKRFLYNGTAPIIFGYKNNKIVTTYFYTLGGNWILNNGHLSAWVTAYTNEPGHFVFQEEFGEKELFADLL